MRFRKFMRLKTSSYFGFVAKHQKSKQKLAQPFCGDCLNVFDTRRYRSQHNPSIITHTLKERQQTYMDKQFGHGSKAINPLIKTLFEDKKRN